VFQRHIAHIKPNRHLLDANYLSRVLETPSVRKQADRVARGVAQKTVTLSSLRNFQIHLPPLAEQRRIAAILDKADELRRKRKRALDLIQNLIESSFIQMFGDERSSRFEVKRLDAVTDQITDGAHFTPTYVEKGVPFLRVTDLQNKTIDWARVKYIPQEEHNELLVRCRPEPGDILLSKNGTIGISRYIDWAKAFSIFVSLCLIKPTKSILSGVYLASFLKTNAAQRQFRQHAKTGTVTNLHLVEIRKLLIPIPPLNIQREWEALESRFRYEADKHAKAASGIESLFSSLQDRAFSGHMQRATPTSSVTSRAAEPAAASEAAGSGR
jgi:type I restriction enzyme, S subunit